MRTLLLITGSFLPCAGSGVHRNVGYAKYLPQYGWRTIVLAKRPPPGAPTGSPEVPWDGRYCQVVGTRSLELLRAMRALYGAATGRRAQRDPQEAARAKLRETGPGRVLWRLASQFLFIPDADIGWLPYAVAAGRRIMAGRRVDAILSSGPPFTAHIVGLVLSARFGVPLVADFRDPWTQSAYVDARQERLLGGALDRRLERAVLGRAAAVIGVSRPLVDAMAAIRVARLAEKLHVITNGFDPEDFRGVSREVPAEFTITYTGSFMWEQQSISPVLAALRDLVERGEVPTTKIRLRVVEAYPQDTLSAVRAHNLADIVTVLTGLPHRQAIQEQLNASVLLLLVGRDRRTEGVYTGKIFEYLAAGRPILALAPPGGVAASLIREARAGVVVGGGDPDELGRAILAFYREYEARGSVAWAGDPTVVGRYARPRLAGQLASLLDGVCPAGTAPTEDATNVPQ